MLYEYLIRQTKKQLHYNRILTSQTELEESALYTNRNWNTGAH